jgi:hypothetical protein
LPEQPFRPPVKYSSSFTIALNSTDAPETDSRLRFDAKRLFELFMTSDHRHHQTFLLIDLGAVKIDFSDPCVFSTVVVNSSDPLLSKTMKY